MRGEEEGKANRALVTEQRARLDGKQKIHLLSYEKHLVADFLLMNDEAQDKTLQAAINDWKASGPLIRAYRLIYENIYSTY